MKFSSQLKVRGKWTSKQLAAALNDIKDGNSIRSAGLKYSVPESTLRRRLKAGEAKVLPPQLGRRTIFSQEQEAQMTERLKEMASIFIGMTPKMYRKVAFQIAAKMRLKNNFNKEKEIAGRKWFQLYLKRNSGLSIRKPEATSLNRIQGFCKEEIENFFINMASTMSKQKFSPSRINIDEAGFTTVHRPTNVIAPKGLKQFGAPTSGERGKTVTVVCCVSATGVFIPPMFIFARKRMDSMLAIAPICTIRRIDC